MPSHWFGWILSRHCPEVKREISILQFLKSQVLDFPELHKNIKKSTKNYTDVPKMRLKH